MRGPLLLAALVLGGCDQPASVAPAASASAVASAAPSPSAAEPAAPPPADLDVAALQKALKCGGEKSGACGVLSKFATCTAWNPAVPSGDGRWIGHGYLVDGAKTTEQI